MKLAFDIEADGLQLDATKIHCIVLSDVITGETYSLHTQEQYDDFYRERFDSVECFIGHNIIDYDCPVLEKILGWDFGDKRVFDTLVASKLVYGDIKDADVFRAKAGKMPPNLIGSYSLKAFGYRLNEHKQEFTTDWSEFSEEMLEYCEQDVKVTKLLYKKIREKGVPIEALGIEQDIREIVSRQSRYGWKFDYDKANELYMDLTIKRLDIEAEVSKFFPDFVDHEEFIPKVNNKSRGYVKGVPFTKEIVTKFNCGSRQHIARGLIEQYGWEPEEFTETGIPKINEGILNKLEYEGAKRLGDYFVIQKTLGMVGEGKNAWLKMSRDSRIHGQVDTIGAVTGRMTHSRPNMSQVPACYSPYGTECRQLFTASQGNKLVGCDASGLELRCLAHYMGKYDNGAYADIILNGDVHTANMNALGIDDRNKAKTFIYAFLYGAGLEKIGTILGCSTQEAGATKARFLKELPALGELIDQVSFASSRGYLLGLDRRHIPVRSAHSALNALLQSAGAVVMKKALQILAPKVYFYGGEFVGNIHDEWQIDVHESFKDDVGREAVDAIVKAGEHFNFLCPLDGEYKVGNNWAETH